MLGENFNGLVRARPFQYVPNNMRLVCITYEARELQSQVQQNSSGDVLKNKK